MRQRTRLLQPDQFVDEELAKLPSLVRLMFCALPTIADKAGRLPDRPALIKLFTLPYDNIDPDEALQILANGGFIIRYCVDNSQFIQIRSWNKYQKPHHKEEESQLPVLQHEIHACAKHDSSMTQACVKHEPSIEPLPSCSNSELDSNPTADLEYAATVDNLIAERRTEFKALVEQYTGQIDIGLLQFSRQYNKTIRDARELFKSHMADMETDFVMDPDKWAKPVQAGRFARFCVGWIKRVCEQKGGWHLGDYGFKCPVSKAEEDAHYQQHKDNAACRQKQAGDDTFSAFGDALKIMEAK